MTNTATKAFFKHWRLRSASFRVFTLRAATFLLISIVVLGLGACQNQAIHQTYAGAPKPASEVATLEIPKSFELLFVDGERYKKLFLTDGATFSMLPGTHQIVIEYDDIWNINSEEHERITSQPLMVSFVAEAGKRYGVAFKELKNIEDAKTYSRKPTVEIFDAITQQTVASKIVHQLKDKSEMANFVSNANKLDVTVASTTIDANNEPAQPQTPQANLKEGPALEMLQYWWQQADPNQQQNFLRWLDK